MTYSILQNQWRIIHKVKYAAQSQEIASQDSRAVAVTQQKGPSHPGINPSFSLIDSIFLKFIIYRTLEGFAAQVS
jgi:hypothetical protein